MSASAPPYDPTEDEKAAFVGHHGPPPAYQTVYPDPGGVPAGQKPDPNYRPPIQQNLPQQAPAPAFSTQGPNISRGPVAMPATVQHTTIVVNTGNCPRCNVGSLVEESNSCCFCCCALAVILTFPFGLLLLCCFPKDKYFKCPNCGYKND